ncbi:glycoside hydrolase family 25 protein [Hominiventricola aquisgranensis]|uniref:GH25 family lysozyme n=1 Tax=Hominiventricola aquisgranensis TaxID=3133164 RepID=A0ABV1I1Y2_9FIRM
MKKILGMKLLSLILAGVVAAGSIGAGGYVIYGYESLPKEVAEAQVIEDPGPEPEEEAEEEPVEEEEIEEEEEEEEPVEEDQKELSLACTSIEKDLKIKIEDQKSKLVTGEQFSVSVKSDKKNAKVSTYEDKDKDGIIYIDKIEAGKYTVTLENAGSYAVKKGTMQATVKDKIEYKKVDVKDEIKMEAQINTAVEDTAKKDVPQESTLNDTVPLLESKVSTSKVSRADVDVSNFSKASASSKMVSVTLTKSAGTTTTEPTTPTTPTEPGNGDHSGGPIEPGKNDDKGDGDNSGGTTIPEQPTEPTTPEPPSKGEGTSEQSLTTALRQIFSMRTVYAAAEQTTDTNAKAAVAATTATVTLPETVTLYNGGSSASDSLAVALHITGESALIKQVKWSSSNAGVVALSGDSGNSVTLTAKSKGSAEVTATITYVTDAKETTKEASVKTKVTVADFSDSSVVLKDKSGNVLYTDANATKQATLKDYAFTDTFYTSPQYTGWRTDGGKVYYYDANHNKITGNQVIGGVMYTFGGDGALSQSSGNRGIDVSKYQGNIDWGAVAASGINFAIIRVGYRGSSSGALVQDPYFKKNISGATKAGIKVGLYFFTQAVNEAEAVEEASMAMSLASGYKVTYPIFIDTESASGGRANGLSKSARTAVVKAFCQTVRNGGYKAGVYASKSWYANQLNASALNGYCIWVAQYNSSCTYSGKYDMWQYSSKGSVSGIKGNVDMNISYTGY